VLLKIQVSFCNLLYKTLILVIAVAANKSDLFEKEQVPEKEARDFAKSIGAIFRSTSAYSASGIEDLFKAIGLKFLDPNYVDEESSQAKPPASSSSGGAKPSPSPVQQRQKVTLQKDKITTKKDKKKCC
jgi:hypothetical protein